MDIQFDSKGGIRQLQMESRHWQEMKRHVLSCLPEEACGILAGVAERVYEVIPVTNVLHSPSRFRMDPEEQLAALVSMEEKGYQMVGIFHSHTHGPVGPSETDLQESAYPELAYLIWSDREGDWRCRAFCLTSQGAVEIGMMIQSE